SPLSQLLAIIVDYLLIKVSWIFTFGFFVTDDVIEFIYTTIGFFLTFVLVPLMWHGKTFGTALMRSKLVRTRENPPFRRQLLKRAFALYLPFMLPYVVKMSEIMEFGMDSIFYPYHVWGTVAIIVFLYIM